MNPTTSLTASEAREKLYSLIKNAAKGLRSYEIKLRGAEPVVLISKNEIDSWLETLDILSNPKEAKAIRSARKEKRLIPLEE
ncbi:type II toxin-antitoxin system Phd/YefM family antitoxin [Candidatus Microgenomates bacterium]|nr:type II toxin-antitoxin system Phd/YefM family antitoxin [Candidatus Microgenomates bacterium]